MILYYIRHGDPIYHPNQLTPLGERQAEAVAKRVAVHGVDRIYSSPSNRARQTAEPLCQITKMLPEILDWSDEDRLYLEMAQVDCDGKKQWPFRHSEYRNLLNSREVRELGRLWYTHPRFADIGVGPAIARIQRETDDFLESLGYKHDLENNCYHQLRENNDRVAFFAHEGIGVAILSCILDIPYPMMSTHYDMTHTGVTVIQFEEKFGSVIPQVLTFSNDSHLYREGLPTKHQNRTYY